MRPEINIRQLSGKQLFGTARQHAVVTDRPLEEGGTNLGCTSGELLLLAIGSCYLGSLRAFFGQQGVQCGGLSANVFYEPQADARRRDRIVIAVTLDDAARAFDADAIKAVASSGGVTSRIQLGSEIEVRIVNSQAGSGAEKAF